MQATPQPQPQVSLAPPIVPTIEPLSQSSNQASSSMTKTTKEKKKKTTTLPSSAAPLANKLQKKAKPSSVASIGTSRSS
jgi:hypothetical protein